MQGAEDERERHMNTALFRAALAVSLSVATAPAAVAQGAAEPGVTAEIPAETVFDGDFVTIGFGLGLVPSYSGSDDYVLFPLPLVQGSVAGIDFDPRPAGIAVDFVPDNETGPSFRAGFAVSINRNRVDQIEDEIVEAYGELDTAVLIGPALGAGVSGLLNPFDSLNLNLDISWDIAGAHGGRVISPSVSYFTPFSRGIAGSLSFGLDHVDDDLADYYYSVPAANELLGENALPGFEAEGGFESVGANLLIAFDLNGDVTDGGFAIVGITGYSRLLNDAKRTPFTRLRGDADQWFGGVALGYTF
jgi:outer membrane scaffolding protein for murein synthesis (MipA/OmpV family)